MTAEALTPKKDYFAPMHTAEHVLNQTMVRLFGCARSKNAHIEKNKSKCDYFLPSSPTQQQMDEVQKQVNDVLGRRLPVTAQILSRAEAALYRRACVQHFRSGAFLYIFLGLAGRPPAAAF